MVELARGVVHGLLLVSRCNSPISSRNLENGMLRLPNNTALVIRLAWEIPINMPGQTKYFLWRIDGKLVMFLFGLVSKDMFIDYYVGFDYSVTHKYHLYFVKFRETLNWCIKNRIKQYEMGITGYEPKRRLGFDFVPLYIYVKLRNRALRPAFAFLCQFLKFENFDPSLKEGKRKRAI